MKERVNQAKTLPKITDKRGSGRRWHLGCPNSSTRLSAGGGGGSHISAAARPDKIRVSATDVDQDGTGTGCSGQYYCHLVGIGTHWGASTSQEWAGTARLAGRVSMANFLPVVIASPALDTLYWVYHYRK